MAVYQEVGLLNFVVVGEVRSGTSVVQSTLCNRPGAVCHGDLLHYDEETRRAAHESYYGPCKKPDKLPEWFVEGGHPWQYINHTILDNPRNGETSVGFRVMYPQVRRWELYELLEAKCREGDFCVVHVVRNPVACFISLKQAQKSGIWTRSRNCDEPGRCPSPVSIDTNELVQFVRDYDSVCGKIRAFSSDILEVRYKDLFLDYQSSMRTVFDFLELPDDPDVAVSSCARLRNRSFKNRVWNWDRMVSELPGTMRHLLDPEDLV